MLKLIRYNLIVLMLLLSIDKLYAKNYFTANVYNPYNPAQAIATCPEAGVWPNDPSEPFPDPNPASSDCGEINSQVAYGCNIKSTNIGDTLLQSVVVIEVPDISGKPSHDCTATVVNQQWVITAAHCVANFDVNSPTVFKLTRQIGNFEDAYILSSITKTILVYVEGQDGKLSFRQNIKMDDAPTDIEFSADNSYAYVAHSASKRITIFKVDSEGRLDDIGAIATGAISGGMSLSPSGKYLLVSNLGEASVSVYETMHHVSWLEPTSKFVSRGYTPIMITTLPK